MADASHIQAYTKQWEGGLSNAKTDHASANPSPCTYKGETGWHTNKGVIYPTFVSLAPKLGYAPTCENFINMPDSIWMKIFKYEFWDTYDLDNYKSQALAEIVNQWAWGSGNAGAYKQIAKVMNKNYGMSLPETTNGYSKTNALFIRDKMNALVASGKEKDVHQKLLDQYKEFIYALNQPVYTKGWLNRLSTLHDFTTKSLGVTEENIKKNWKPIVAAMIFLGGTLFLILYKK